MSIDVNVVCPHCENQETYNFIGPSEQNTKCGKCSKLFSFVFVKIRAKKSRGSRKDNTRTFDVRVYLNDGSEDFIQFDKSGWDDIELRSKDNAVFAFIGDDVRIVQNIQIGSYTAVSKPSCYIATHIYGSNSSEVVFLRKWRDRTLSQTLLGQKFIKVYYASSPTLLKWFGTHSSFTLLSRSLLNKFIKLLGFKGT